jgi:superfamily II DNA helicase RecQ
MQLRVVLANHQGKDALIAAGTGSGKTLPIALSILLDDPDAHNITITISPLKRLQVTQESDFNLRFGIPTVTINEDTPRENEWWNVSIRWLFSTICSLSIVQKHVYNTATRRLGTSRHLIVTVEQLFKCSAGHLGRLGAMIRERQDFQRRIIRINVDEAHSIHTAGIPLYGIPAFRPAWGDLNKLKAILPNRIRWNAFSATFPPHILKTVTDKILKPDHITIRVTSNRPNTIYTTHQVHGSIEDVQNYQCFILEPFDFQKQPHILIFVNDKTLATKIARHLDACLPVGYRAQGIVKHYHSGMSEMYLQQTHESFVKKDGTCRILAATSGESVVSNEFLFVHIWLTIKRELIFQT